MERAFRKSWLVLLAASACTLDAKLPQGRIACVSDDDCPAHWSCHVRTASEPALCYRSADDAGLDAGQGQDADAGASPSDASASDAAPPRDANTSDATMSEDASASDASADSAVGDAAIVDASSGPPPTVQAVTASRRFLDTTQQSKLSCLATDPLGATLQYAWSSGLGTFADATKSSTQFSSTMPGLATARCTVSARGAMTSGSTELRIYPADWLVLLRFTLDASDSSGHGNDATLAGGVFGNDHAGATGAALQCDGNTTATLPNESTFELKAWSFVASVEPAHSAGGTLLSKGSVPGGTYAILLYPDSDQTLPGRLQYFQQASNGPTYSSLLGTYSAQAGKFFQLAVTRSEEGELRTYIDGALDGTTVGVPVALQNANPVTIGNGPLGGFTGTLDEVQLYDRVLTAAEVAALHALW